MSSSTRPMLEYRADSVCMVGFLNMKEGISTEQFRQYWREHGELFRSVPVVKKNIRRYEQFHPDDGMKSTAAAAGISVMDFDGMAILEAESFEVLNKVFEDEEFKRVILPDEKRFIDRKDMVVWPLQIVTGIERSAKE